jgi:hypothetical protein
MALAYRFGPHFGVLLLQAGKRLRPADNSVSQIHFATERATSIT